MWDLNTLKKLNESGQAKCEREEVPEVNLAIIIRTVGDSGNLATMAAPTKRSRESYASLREYCP